ncbi:SMP-30/gluconolactonase/LRE family protein [Kineococcus indalonis]|uniref:SMP-30/gluconolactonase/LRE family protein n=1 Tax=Kineococcus indalonis TaxID=2696566 RepID=UPI001411E550|nr:SMP-30/gluconolactonase/LRE family protein [Kineococcus indalonis]NAZ86364.1 SMP-30/gluconolactonase/LRE family protein [Kineococcus indalonis]
MAAAERITDRVVYHGEGPCWSPQWGGLRFVDMVAGDVLTLTPSGELTRRRYGDVAAIVRPRAGGGAVVAVERGFVLEDADGALTPLPELWGAAEGLRMNEGGCDPHGRFYAGSMAYEQDGGAGEGRGSIFRLDPDGSVRTVLTGVTISNGLGFSPDGALAYYNDTPTGRTDVFDYDREAGLTNRRPFAQVQDASGSANPDGLCVDAEGGVWTALFGGSAVRRYAPDGTLDAVVEVGARQVTACTFGGADLDELFITTSRENLADDDDPAAGSVFRFTPGVRGLPVLPFAG